jgi:hypothetical protein
MPAVAAGSRLMLQLPTVHEAGVPDTNRGWFDRWRATKGQQNVAIGLSEVSRASPIPN